MNTLSQLPETYIVSNGDNYWVTCNVEDPFAGRNFSGIRKISQPWQVIYFAKTFNLIPPRAVNKKLMLAYLREFRVMLWVNSIRTVKGANVKSVFYCLWLFGKTSIPEYEKADRLFNLFLAAV